MGIPASGVTNTAYRTVTEFTATAGQTTFSVPSYTVGFITVLRNGVRLNSADFTASNGTTVVLTNAATAGDAVTTESFYISSVINAIPSVAGAVNSTYLLDGAVTQAKLGTNVAGNGPAMVAYQNAQTSLSAGVVTKINFQLSLYDTNSNYSTSTSKFTPTVAGYYFINAGVSFNNACSSQGAIYKNGTAFLWTSYPQLGNGFVISGIVQMNGSTDYIEIDGYSSVANQTQTGVTNSQFQAFLIRSL
jgi:hypothetical protein